MSGIGAGSKVSSMRDLDSGVYRYLVRRLKSTVNRVSSLRDLDSGVHCYLVRRLKSTVNRVASLRDCVVDNLIRHFTINLTLNCRDFFTKDARTPKDLYVRFFKLLFFWVLRLFVWKLWQSGRIASLGRNDIAPHLAAIR